MKTLLLTYDYPPAVGGVANVLSTFFRLAGSPGCLIVAPAAPGARDHDRAHPVRTVRFPSAGGRGGLGKLAEVVAATVWTALWLSRHRPDVLIAGQVVRCAPILSAWRALTGRPYDVWVYGGETRAGFTAVPWLTRWVASLLRGARVVFTNSPYTSEEMRRFGLADDRVVELPRGVDRTRFEPAPKDARQVERLGLDGKLVFLTLGRLIERKGVDTVLQALAGLAGRLPPWRYLVVGDGPYRPQLEALTERLGLGSRVTFTGRVPPSELPTYYNLCDVFVMPNREVAARGRVSLSIEGFGTVFLEAAACGKPVIAGRSGGAVHAVADGVNGLIVDPTDPADVQRALLALADPGPRGAMAAAGPRFAARFSWEASADVLRRYLSGAPDAATARP